MKTKSYGELITQAVMVAICLFMMVSCSKGSDDPDRSAAIVMKPAENITLTGAKLVAKTTAAENIVFKYSVKDKNEWQTITASSSQSGDSISLTAVISGLAVNTDYEVMAVTTGTAKVVSSATVSFKTYGVSDYDGNLYHLITIGKQTWLQENFRGTHYADGTPIAKVAPQNWSDVTTPCYCDYDNNEENSKIYGRLYNWYVGSKGSKVLITGMHVPCCDEWFALQDFLGEQPFTYALAGPKMMEPGTAHWRYASYAPPTVTPSGFNALPNGYLTFDASGRKFMELGTDAIW
jgi:uncharacterized protein (TIGR02145 family)